MSAGSETTSNAPSSQPEQVCRRPSILGDRLGPSREYGKTVGQFKPIAGANPTIGSVGALEHVEENRVEVLVRDEGKNEEIQGAVKELKVVSLHRRRVVSFAFR